MTALEVLSRAMHEVNDRFAIPSFNRHVEAMQGQVRSLEAWLGEVGGARPTSDRARQALQRFHERQVLEHVKDARLVCFGCAEPIGGHNHRLIEDRARFPRLLEIVDRFRVNARSYRRCYRGLLFSYFAYDGAGAETPSAGRDNWQFLRTYLRERVDSICAPGHEPEWVPAIQEHRNLLSEAPCERYGRKLLQGDDALFEEVKRRLDVPGASWLVRSIVMAQVRAATVCPDHEFRGFLAALFPLLSVHPLLVNDALAQILARYSRCRPPDEHADLRDFAVAAWGNPWLRSNAAKWGLVDDPCRQMVAAWLKRDLMKLFFELLSQDGRNDKRRFEFWAQYLDKIEDMYFALGSVAGQNRSADFRLMRKKMEGRLLNLKSGSPDNSAFIIKIDRYYLVEFAVTSNACYVFEDNPIRHARHGMIAADTSGLKHPNRVARLIHIGQWEEQFEQEVYGLTGQQPTRSTRTGRGVRASEARSGTTSVNPRVATAPYSVGASPHDRQPFSESSLAAFVARNRLEMSDYRPHGGFLWVHIRRSEEHIFQQLRAWGFSSSQKRPGWWKRDH